MAKNASKYVCGQCGAEFVRWMGRCSECGEWNSVTEMHLPAATPGRASRPAGPPAVAVPLEKVAADPEERRPCGIGELDRVLGGGVVAGSLVLVSGDPGIGKSTLLLQMAHAYSERHGGTLYVSGEESAQQVKMRAARLGVAGGNLYVLAETDIGQILAAVEALSPALVVVDSVQTLYDDQLESAPGTVSQVRQCAAALMRLAKESGTPVFLVGHVTKEGTVAGPRVLEHMVDAVLHLEGERSLTYRLLRGLKNRFGSTNELGIFEMQSEGLVEVANPSAAFLHERQAGTCGSAVVATIEGTRPLLIEVQALVTPASPFGAPRRSATGLDYQRAMLVLAVLEKRAGLALGSQDVYLNIPGGVKITEPAADLGVAMAVASSMRDRPVRPDLVFAGEVGLTGEVRSVSQPERRAMEAARLGFAGCCLAAGRRQAEGIIAVDDLVSAFRVGLVQKASLKRTKGGEQG